MVSLDEIQSFMKVRLMEDKSLRRVKSSGETLEDALQQAAIELGLALRKIDYEITQRGSPGTFGLGKKPWKLVAYAAKQKKERKKVVKTGEEEVEAPQNTGDKSGGVFVRRTPGGVFLKVTSPSGKGARVQEKAAFDKIRARFEGNVDTAAVSRAVKAADGKYVKIAEYSHAPLEDPLMTVEITDGEMKAFITLQPPGPGGADPSFDTIVNYLTTNNVVAGFINEAIESLVDNAEYSVPRLVAEGIKPKPGKDAGLEYTFEADKPHVRLHERNGKIDFKELNLIQNVVEGQVLARKTPATPGEPGSTVTGKPLQARDGVDEPIEPGKNVRISEDGNCLIAETNGQAIIMAGKVNVEPINTIAGDVNLKTGNILFLGTVIVKGNVEDGFSIKASGDIEVMGSVGCCELDAEGDIIVHQGITGKSSGKIMCGKSVWAKFIENADVEAGEYVVVSDGIMNSRIIANKKIVCKGKRGSIVGGHCMAAEEIDAKTLGSRAGGETILEVGYDPRSKGKLDKLHQQAAQRDKEIEEVTLNLRTLENLKRTNAQLPEDKQAYYEELTAKKEDIEAEIDALNTEIEEIKLYLNQLNYTGKVGCAGTVFPGVLVIIKDARLEVRNEFKIITFVLEEGIVKAAKYEESTEDLTRKT
ncbi:MAG: FapA family protein [Spirochaetales bacterium]|jgi:uncharacterized protein (DUF342 family)|nr:FapA family protein [Spirochaetales bacterium]